MTRWYVLGFTALAIVFVGLEALRRRREFLNGPNYVEHLRQWHRREPVGDEPRIAPAPLPAIVPLKATVGERPHRVARFKIRIGEGR